MSHVIRLVAVHTWVLSMARDESLLATYGAPPLNPLHPIHSRPAPVNIISMLFGGNLSLSLSVLGPTLIYIYVRTYKLYIPPYHYKSISNIRILYI